MEKTCPFCLNDGNNRIVIDSGTVIAIRDLYPVTRSHHLIIPKRHVATYFEMTEEEKRDSDTVLKILRDKILAEDATVQGFNIGINCGTVAGQTVMHAHIHLIPRRAGDIEDPRGGVRGCVPDKMSY